MASARSRPRRTTINDVAAQAGVAASTVSRAFTRPGRINSTTRDHILAVAEELGYTPNASARALESGRSDMVGLVVPDITNPYFSGMIKGAEHAAAAAGKTLLIGDTGEDLANEEALVRRLSSSVDGLVLAASRLPDAVLTTTAQRMPVTLINRAAPQVPGVVADYVVGTEQIVAHIAQLGHQGFVFLGGPAESWSGASRWSGLQKAAEKWSLRATRLGPFPPTFAAAPTVADSLLEGALPTAIITHNDILAIGVMRRLRERGVDIPGDLSVVGFDDIFGADFCDPPLTTLAEPSATAGSKALELLLDPLSWSGNSTAQLLLPTQLRVRLTTAPPRHTL